MTKTHKRTEKIHQFIIENIAQHPKDIATMVAHNFNISRQAVNKHIQHLITDKIIDLKGHTKNRYYFLSAQKQWRQTYALNQKIEEDWIWKTDIEPLLDSVKDNVIELLQYGVTEILNNAIDHSCGQHIKITLVKTAATLEITIADDGEGIFKKIQRAFDLYDERHAVLELAKGKVTTDPNNHTGEGIFFSSRALDELSILSGNVYFSHLNNKEEDWILKNHEFQKGTMIIMKILCSTTRKLKSVFDAFTSSEDYVFDKTIVPIQLAQYGHEKLISRSQAKRILAHIERFKTVIFDFDNVDMIGQGFADQIFRVFHKKHPDITLLTIRTNENVK